MKYLEFKESLQKLERLTFIMPNGILFPAHFHITEVGRTNKQFIDCGGLLRNVSEICIQLWLAEDRNHCLSTKKLLHILGETERQMMLPDENVLVELQGETIEKYAISLSEKGFLLLPTHTACLAEDTCGIIPEKAKLDLANLGGNSCSPGSGCC